MKLHFAALATAALVATAACDKAPTGGTAGAGATGATASAGTSPAAAKASFRGADITGATYARALSLTDANGTPRTLADFKGKVVAVFFGYTQCPDACPTTMAELAAVKKALGPDGDRLQAVFVSLDPERDTPAILKSYVTNFDPTFVALRGTPEQTKAAADEFKVFYVKVPGKTEGAYTLDHTAGTFLLDTNGQARIFERYGAGVEVLTADIKALLAG